jgi:hypothetical protein
MLKPVTFYSEGVKLAGDLFLPADIKPGERRAGIVLCHGYTGVRSIYFAGQRARPRRGRLRCADLRLQGLGATATGENPSGAL